MTQVLRQRQWRLTISLLATVAWLLGTNFCALGLMARPCAPDVAPAVLACEHCPVKSSPTTPAPLAPCCQEVHADLPPTAAAGWLPPASLVSPTDWVSIFSLAPLTALEESAAARVPDTGPPTVNRTAMRVLLGRCAPVNAPPALG